MVLFQSPNVFPGFLDAEDTARTFKADSALFRISIHCVWQLLSFVQSFRVLRHHSSN